jgi:archaeosortase A (PGF-CTERM-specific)
MGNTEKTSVGFLFLIIPTIMLIVGYFIYPYPAPEFSTLLLQIPMFLGLILILIGFIAEYGKYHFGKILKILGWLVFTFYWATQPATLYLSEEGDIFNSVVCIIGVFVLCYIAYHEWLSYERKEYVSCLNWIAGASAIAGLIYFIIERTSLSPWLIEEVAKQSELVLRAIIGNSDIIGTDIYLDGHYAVTIIFACTAIQAMVIFVGMIIALPKVDIKRKVIGLLITIIPIYILNLFRNAMVAFLVGRNITDFFMAHNVISKTGALITLIVLLYFVIRLMPEIFDEIMCLIDLRKRNGPLEKAAKKIFGRKK